MGAEVDSAPRARSTGAVSPRGPLAVRVPPDAVALVTGANGFIGAKVVECLLNSGYARVRCLARPTGNTDRLDEVIARSARPGCAAETLRGNLLNSNDCARAVDGVSVIFHLAAGIDKSYAGCFMNSVLTTRNLLDAVVAAGTLKRFVNVSSFAVYSNLRMRRRALLDETAPLEDDFQSRCDAYGFGKLKQEQIVDAYHRQHGVPYVTLRPGAVFGPGKRALSGRVGIDTFGVFLHLGGSNRIPLTFVDNCAEAIVLAGSAPGVEGEVANVVDDDLPTSRSLLRGYKRHAGRFWSLPVPYRLAWVLSAAWEDYSRRSGEQLPPRFNRRRCAAEWKGNRYSNEKLKRLLGWSPRVPMQDALRVYFESLSAGA